MKCKEINDIYQYIYFCPCVIDLNITTGFYIVKQKYNKKTKKNLKNLYNNNKNNKDGMQFSQGTETINFDGFIMYARRYVPIVMQVMAESDYSHIILFSPHVLSR